MIRIKGRRARNVDKKKKIKRGKLNECVLKTAACFGSENLEKYIVRVLTFPLLYTLTCAIRCDADRDAIVFVSHLFVKLYVTLRRKQFQDANNIMHAYMCIYFCLHSQWKKSDSVISKSLHMTL